MLSTVVLVLWQFPAFWYTRTNATSGRHWLSERRDVPGWKFEEIPLSKSAERVLVADRLFNGELRSEAGETVRVFSAKRYADSSSEIGLFVHTPDRCWTETGWTMEPTQPDRLEIRVHGIPITFERRIFNVGSKRELVYFAGLVGGQPLPYRLDHNLSVGMRHAKRTAKDKTGTTLRASDHRFWVRIWDSFLARRPLIGPKQFVRISTAILGDDVARSDRVLTEVLATWLEPVNYGSELDSWKQAENKQSPP